MSAFFPKADVKEPPFRFSPNVYFGDCTYPGVEIGLFMDLQTECRARMARPERLLLASLVAPTLSSDSLLTLDLGGFYISSIAQGKRAVDTQHYHRR